MRAKASHHRNAAKGPTRRQSTRIAARRLLLVQPALALPRTRLA
jgi:hypothetical protein